MTASRYDDHGAWYVDYTSRWELSSTASLPRDLNGLRMLDLGCGWGQLSHALAGRGAAVTAVDLSASCSSEPETSSGGIRSESATCTATPRAWTGGTVYRVRRCGLQHGVDGHRRPRRRAAHGGERVAPSGWFNLSLLHPCFPVDTSVDALPSWPTDRGYAAEGWWTTGSVGMRGHVGAHHLPSTYLNAVLHAGLEFESFIDPAADLPRVLIIQGRRPRQGTHLQ